MATKVKTEIIDLKISNFDSSQHECARIDLQKEHFITNDNQRSNTTKYLKLYTSLIGEDSPEITSLPNNYVGESLKSYRYDWLFGISCIHNKEKNIFWDWSSKLRENNTIKLQLSFDIQPYNSDLFINVQCANLLSLNPSKNTASWFERHREGLDSSLKSLAGTAKEYSKIASDVISTANVLTNFISSDENGKNWYLYKFLDQDRNTFAIEWHINKKVLEQYGPMLQGSIVVNFHGSFNQQQRVRLSIRPFLSFTEKLDMCYVSPYEDLKIDHYIELNPK
jgi:hypothetical protein